MWRKSSDTTTLVLPLDRRLDSRPPFSIRDGYVGVRLGDEKLPLRPCVRYAALQGAHLRLVQPSEEGYLDRVRSWDARR